MSEVLVDTSAWIHYLRSGEGPLAESLERLLEDNKVLLCGIVLAEVRQGLRPHEEADVLALFETLPYIDSLQEDFHTAGELLARLRRQGITVPVTDGVIAAQALRYGVSVLEHDKHFSTIDGVKRVSWRDEEA